MPRQARMAMPNAPRIAPTAIKTVPSGRVEWFIKGASAVGGTVGGGKFGISVLSVPVSVGKPLSGGGGGPVVPVGRLGSVKDDWLVLDLVLVFVDAVPCDGVDRCVPVLLVCVFLFVVEVVPPVVVCEFWARTLPLKKTTATTAEKSERFNECLDEPIVASSSLRSRREGEREEGYEPRRKSRQLDSAIDGRPCMCSLIRLRCWK